MPSKLHFPKPLLVLAALVLAALACYSDNPLWPYELTAPPPSPTFLPTPDASSDTAKFGIGDTVTAPIDMRNPAPFLFLANHPEAVRRDLTNASGNCVWETEYEVLYAGLKSEVEQEKVYYLINCRGAIGWTPQDVLAGPLRFAQGQSALTIAEEAQGNVFPLYSQPPVNPALPPDVNECPVNDVVDIRSFTVLTSTGPAAAGQGANGDPIWYQIECSNGTLGWTDQARLFGPLVLNIGSVGIVNPDLESIPLTLAPGPADEGEVVGECPGDALIEAQAVELVDQIVYYQIACEGDVAMGWTIQDPLIELPFVPGDLVLVVLPEVAEELEEAAADTDIVQEEEVIEDETEEEEVLDDDGEGEDEQLDPDTSAPLTANPGPASDDNEIVGLCPNEAIVEVQDATVRLETFHYNVVCDDVTGWLEQIYTLTSVPYRLGDSVAITEAGFVGIGQERAFYISEEPQRVAGARSSIGACQPSTVTLEDVAYDTVAGSLRTYYQFTCISLENLQITGWANEERLQPVSVAEDDTSTGLFGG